MALRFPISSYHHYLENPTHHTDLTIWPSKFFFFLLLQHSMHATAGGDTMLLVHLDVADEYLTGISGFYGPIEGYNGLEAITSITFHTNKRKHGPYGEESGVGYTYFTSTVSPGKALPFA
ncbi:hypothetical protein L6452_34048 [Arctium lappa]|uniref:Uncharacterized protein n=1 Tax=Arctium lappa TaxID=4217 RepID=A0ACB8YHS4_ARCLA|nr:hypothetical protein L6452_34048 [Arctium lappa]